ncbi:uncharacterized protein LACBIDRAFT_304925 [Laccaria bicolor S238N-H82]|uniref:Predicted protein n=1 Tax=Laccaria bicolor (strain S238N-H82 / ATCC MYA-4686) TaxID=486041 RepID=B0DMN5_LACBS|nr:uncharacterized protein LACBIDRAFT_304925 [Laccaria bicolor S238N-H82]EDR04318.1 predicted protein [Laccaria bicolor S238N-H82]|eukprot:XP_001885209.1 predicted protein [Laccaria bicolor S238N-H82]
MKLNYSNFHLDESSSHLRSHSDTKILDERRVGLETYLRAILSAKEDTRRGSFAFEEFLGIPVVRQELQSRLQDDINKRDDLSDRGDVGASVAAKSKLAVVLARIGALGKGLEELAVAGMSEGELQRRTDMIARLHNNHEKLRSRETMPPPHPAEILWEARSTLLVLTSNSPPPTPSPPPPSESSEKWLVYPSTSQQHSQHPTSVSSFDSGLARPPPMSQPSGFGWQQFHGVGRGRR